MPVVSIVEVGQAADQSGNGPSSTRVFSVTNRTAKHGLRQRGCEIPSTPIELMGDIRWYLEEFAAKSPLETKLADRIKSALKEVGKTLIKSIEQASVVQPCERTESLILSIQEQPSSYAPIMWELLEDSELWDNPFEGGVFVSRYIDKPKKTPIDTPSKPPKTLPSTLNILVVSVRPSEDKDIPPRIVSKILRQDPQAVQPTHHSDPL